MNERSYFPALTGVRAVAALWVVIYHFTLPGLPAPEARNILQSVAGNGHLGVPLFFSLSGFILTVTLARRRSRQFSAGIKVNAAGEPLRAYLWRRVARIWPVYLTVLALVYARNVFMRGEGIDPSAAAVHLTLTQAWFEDYTHTGVGVAWSLTLEESFYVLLPAIMLWLDGRGERAPLPRAAWRVVLLGLALGLLGVAVVELAPHPHGFMNGYAQYWYYGIWGRFSEFVAGMLAARYAMSVAASGPAWRGNVACALAVAAILGAAVAMDADGSRATAVAANNAVAIAGSVLFVWFYRGGTWAGWALSARVMVYLGRVSYALYLVQSRDTIRGLYHRVMEGWSPLPEPWGFCVFGVAVSIVAAMVLYHTVEVPVQRLILRFAGLSRRGAV